MNLYKSNTYISDLKTTVDMIVNVGHLSGRSILVTGATGLIGSYIIDTLIMCNKKLNTDIKIYAVGRDERRLKKRFDEWNDGSIVYICHDVNYPVDFDVKADYIIHAAANSYPKLFAENPTDTLINSVVSTRYYLEYAHKNNSLRFLYVSSGEIYGQYDGVTLEYPENYSGYVDTLNPRSCYPIGKRAAENLCASFSKQYGLDAVITRLCHTYGANMTSSDNRANAQFLQCATIGQNIIMNSSGSQLRSYCYLADAISAILTVLINGKCHEAYNIANPDSIITIAEFAEIAAEKGGCEVYMQTDNVQKDQLSPISRQVLNVEKLMKLGWCGKFDVETGIKHTINILKESGF